MEILVQVLFERKWLSAVVADKAKAQFSQLCSHASEEWLQMLTSFDWIKERLYVFLAIQIDLECLSDCIYSISWECMC